MPAFNLLLSNRKVGQHWTHCTPPGVSNAQGDMTNTSNCAADAGWIRKKYHNRLRHGIVLRSQQSGLYTQFLSEYATSYYGRQR